MQKPLDQAEEALAQLVGRAGLPRAAARTYVALLRGRPSLAAELAEATRLARQDVSDAARELEACGLVRVDRVASGGRPSLRYALADDAGAALRALVAKRRAALAEEERALATLEARSRS